MALRRKYTYVVGAGASVEFGFPVGDQLTTKIAALLKNQYDPFDGFKSGDRALNIAFRSLKRSNGEAFNTSYLADAANYISRNMGLALSIDNFLEAQKDREGISEVGKLAIARAILQHERDCGLWEDQRKNISTDYSGLKDNWLSRLFRILSAQRDLDGFLKALSCCRFITFNYDRVIEKFFAGAIESYFELRRPQAYEVLLEHLNIVHVYGSLGAVDGANSVLFGDEQNTDINILNAAKRIKTFTEGIDDEEQIELAKGWLQDANCLLFLGFAFLPLNLGALSTRSELSCERIVGTAYGISNDNLGIAKSILQNSWTNRPHQAFDFRPITCKQLISDFSGYLGEYDLVR